ncbi:hypothetical protein EW145_g1766 [Phellinidium pouzarii]|uniref:DUF747-domain-containing protein n=1 Tax=Phellinidium pouzarii TaxID=167371 RepID=A0A4S4LF72_9AGAM|nr:hypothetical protein EW145_g1766 [Phellinidium pouzarii]
MTGALTSRRSRLGRRASASAGLLARPDGKLHGLLSPPSSLTSRRHSSTPAQTELQHNDMSAPFSDESEADYGSETYAVKEESRSPSPLFLLNRLYSSSSVGHDEKLDTLAYASLPSSPISATPVPSPPNASRSNFSRGHSQYAPFSLWDYLREELLATDFDSHQELKWERVSNFLSIPLAIEKILGFGFILCFDSFLHTFTILPIRFALAIYRVIVNIFTRASLPPSQKADILRALLLIASVSILIPLTDVSKIYHSIRGQETIKLYVIFNALEIADRLLSSFGQDILDCVFSRSTLLLLSHRASITSKTIRPFLFFFIATLYIVSHTLVLVYQLTSLNVAINSYDHALLTLLVSNQFVEIKGSVFKKFEKDNLFQITCADIVERFTISLMLFAVALRNMIEMYGSEFDFSEGFVLPKSFGWFREGHIVWTIFYPVLTVLVSEQIVDWLKHAFITKFNHIRPSVYERYMDVLCLDLANGSAVGRRSARKHSYVDQSPIVARRLGFPALPLAVLAGLIGSQSVGLLISTYSLWPITLDGNMLDRTKWVALGIVFWVCCVVIKIIIGVNLVSFATRRRAGMEVREEVDKINDFGRDPIGEGKEEREYNRDLKTLLDYKGNDATRVPDIGENSTRTDGGSKRPKLEELTRFTMVKRIW